MTQERQFPRYAVEAAVTLTVDGTSIEGTTSNLSRGGMCAMMAEPVPVGARVQIDIALVFDNDSRSESLSLTGRVVWCTAFEKGRHQIGLSFTPMKSEQGKFLDLFLKYLKNGDG